MSSKAFTSESDTSLPRAQRKRGPLSFIVFRGLYFPAYILTSVTFSRTHVLVLALVELFVRTSFPVARSETNDG